MHQVDCHPIWRQTEKGSPGLWVMEGGDANQQTGLSRGSVGPVRTGNGVPGLFSGRPIQINPCSHPGAGSSGFIPMQPCTLDHPSDEQLLLWGACDRVQTHLSKSSSWGRSRPAGVCMLTKQKGNSFEVVANEPNFSYEWERGARDVCWIHYSTALHRIL